MTPRFPLSRRNFLRLTAAGGAAGALGWTGHAQDGPPSDTGAEFITKEGKWYQFKVTFTRVSEEGIRVTGEILNVTDDGRIGSSVGTFSPWVYWIKDFPIQHLLEDHELWVALRANGAGGASAIDNLRIAARPLPQKATTPAP